MYLERIIEEKNRRNLSVKTIADTSNLQLPEETIRRMLTRKTANPGIETVLDVAESIGMKPYEIFMDAKLAAEFQAFLELQTKSEESDLERIRLLAENESLKATNAGLVDRLRVLEMELDHKKELLAVVDYFLKNKSKGE